MPRTRPNPPARFDRGFDRPLSSAGQLGMRLESMDGHAGLPTWDTWLRYAGVDVRSAPRGMKINHSAAVLQAAIDGHGIALARGVMAHDDVAAGRLVRLFPRIGFVSPLSYYVVYRPECAALPRPSAFRAWLQDEANAQRRRPK